MSTLQLFIDREELAALLLPLVTQRNLLICRYEGGQFSLSHQDPREVFHVAARVFLLPESHADRCGTEPRPRPRDWGWIDVAIGKLESGKSGPVQTMTTIQVDERPDLGFSPGSWIGQLRRKASVPLTFGVRGRNVVHGGTSDYPRIGYSQKSLELLRKGGTWKQFVDDNAVFVPLA